MEFTEGDVRHPVNYSRLKKCAITATTGDQHHVRAPGKLCTYFDSY